MNRAQKMAFFTVIVISIALATSGIAVTILYFLWGFPKASAGLAFMGITGLAGFAQMIFKKDKGKVEFDERDIIIGRRSALAGFTTAYLVFGLACMTPFFILGPHASIKVTWLPMIFMAAGISHFYVLSIATLIQYRKGGAKNE